MWARVVATVAPLRRAVETLPATAPEAPRAKPRDVPVVTRPNAPTSLDASGRKRAERPGETLDGGWDRRLARGVIAPDRTIDLHGHTLASAHAALDHALERAIADEARVVLVVTGRARPADAQPRRGLIRAAIGDWLGASRHAARIAAIRNAHPRHGGAGALYLILRRRR